MYIFINVSLYLHIYVYTYIYVLHSCWDKIFIFLKLPPYRVPNIGKIRIFFEKLLTFENARFLIDFQIDLRPLATLWVSWLVVSFE